MMDEVVWRVERFGVVESTNSIAFERAQKGEKEGLVVVADAQTGGRGRLGREWFSPAGKNLYMSVLFRPDAIKRQLVSFTCALAVSDALGDFGLDSMLKWPNDVVVGARKICGILCECGEAEFIVAGLGVNLNVDASELPDELRGATTSFLIETRSTLDREVFLKTLLNSLKLWYIKPHFEVLAETRARSATLGKMVKAILPNGEIEGIAEHVDESGALLIRTADGLERIVAGDIVHLR